MRRICCSTLGEHASPSWIFQWTTDRRRMEEAYFVQDRMSWAYEAIGGWKVGAPTPDATPAFAPMPVAWMSCSGCEMRGMNASLSRAGGRGCVSDGRKICLRGSTPYTREEVIAAIASCHPAIEILETALVDPAKASKLTAVADMALHGGFVFGEAVSGLAEHRISRRRA